MEAGRSGKRAPLKLESKKKIGIKYCGGCNPSYDRVEMVQQLQSLLEKKFIFFDGDQQEIDILVLVNGCPKSCANEQATSHPKALLRSIREESDLNNLVLFLRSFDKEGND